MKKLITLDTEIYSNYFLVSFYDAQTDRTVHIELYDGQPLDRQKLSNIMRSYTTLSFNGNNFDLPIIVAALSGYDNASLKKLCDEIIKSNLPAWQITRKHAIEVPQDWDHIDIIEVAPGQSSLKIYGARLHCPTIQDLPIEPDAMINAKQREALRQYCVNDLRTTWALYKSLEKQIALRIDMSVQYGVDLRSKSDAQIAETVIKSELKKQTGRDYRKPELPDGVTFNYLNPRIISFKTEQLQRVFDMLLNTPFELGANGAVKLPDCIAKTNIKIGSTTYNMGIGGLHSCEKSQAVICKDDELLMEQDVAGYYPSIILQQQLAPKSLGLPFLKIYQSIVDRRLKAKRDGDKVTSDTLKIVVNGSFGKLGSRWSALYAPDLLIQTTITGQLALLMLIESFELNGIKVISANTDGVVLHFHKSKLDIMENLAFDWMLTTSYALERTDYKSIFSRDVNNYIAVKPDGSVKRKGVYGPESLSKNPDLAIVYDACSEYLSKGTPVNQTILNCKDISKFVVVRKVTGGALWRGEYLGKTVRFYYSSNVGVAENIEYAKNTNKVPKSDGARPVMSFPSRFPNDIDYDRYINEAEKQLALLGA